MRRFVIEISEDVFDRLSELAVHERRGVKDQAAYLLERQLRSGRILERLASDDVEQYLAAPARTV